jgi:hypothetical protein
VVREDDIKGQRLEPVLFGDLPNDLQPGDYWQYLSRKDPNRPMSTDDIKLDAEGEIAKAKNLTKTVWGYYSPDGNGLGTLMIHTVREEEDGTISVRSGDGSSNSIKHTGARKEVWHGYIEHGVWNEC